LQVKVGFEAELGEKAGDEGQATPRKKMKKLYPTELCLALGMVA
jgi:hypothetical protein